LGDRVEIHVRGRPSEEDIPTKVLEGVVKETPNILYGGPYRNPDELEVIYRSLHFSWCVDYLDAGSNSDWLLPNRIYEGGCYGVLALARANTATGRRVREDGLGWSLPEPLAESVVALLSDLSEDDYASRRRHVLSLPLEDFVDVTDTAKMMERLLPRAAPRSPAGSVKRREARV
jgi:succinoglycan biosynthesis protein ExoL